MRNKVPISITSPTNICWITIYTPSILAFNTLLRIIKSISHVTHCTVSICCARCAMLRARFTNNKSKISTEILNYLKKRRTITSVSISIQSKVCITNQTSSASLTLNTSRNQKTTRKALISRRRSRQTISFLTHTLSLIIWLLSIISTCETFITFLFRTNQTSDEIVLFFTG